MLNQLLGSGRVGGNHFAIHSDVIGSELIDAFFEHTRPDQSNMRLMPRWDGLWKHESDLVTLRDHGLGQTSARCAESSGDERWELPTKHEYPHDSIPVRRSNATGISLLQNRPYPRAGGNTVRTQVTTVGKPRIVPDRPLG